MASSEQQINMDVLQVQHPGKGTATSSTVDPPRPPEQGLKCPRCDSPNTKFCYYNNYSLSQPRHFCKTCRRYWTKGGALRNVPIGGGCRKNKKSKCSSSSSSLASSCRLSSGAGNNSVIGSAGMDHPALHFFHGLSPAAVDFQFGAGLPFSRLHINSSSSNQLISLGGPTAPSLGLLPDLHPPEAPGGFNFQIYPTEAMGSMHNGDHDMGASFNTAAGGGNVKYGRASGHDDNGLASSIESLSCINQDLHWKLQQQRLALFFGGEIAQYKAAAAVSTAPADLLDKAAHKTLSFQPMSAAGNVVASKPGLCLSAGGSTGGSAERVDVVCDRSYNTTAASTSTGAAEWYMENIPYNAAATNGTTTSAADATGNSWATNGIQAWNGIQPFTAIP